MPKFEFGFKESWFRLILKRLPENPDLFSSKAEAVENAQTLLRIGKLKVGAARVWAESAGIIQKMKRDYCLSPFGKIIAKYDPGLEEDGVWWAIHYHLARDRSPAWFYSFYINLFAHETFDRNELETQIRDYWDQNNKTKMTDSVFNKLIFSPFKQVFDDPDNRLGNTFKLFYAKDKDHYARNPLGNPGVPRAIVAYALLDHAHFHKRQSIYMDTLLEPFAPGRIFRLDRETLDVMLVEIGERYLKNVAWISHTANLNSVSIMDLPSLAMIIAYYLELDGKEPHEALTAALNELTQG